MTNMIHKSVDARRARRQRYKKYIDVFRKRFGCTAAQVLDRIETALAQAANEARTWKAKAEALEVEIRSLKSGPDVKDT